ncbi:MAG: hypothetical protein KAI53_00225 [Candidatus Aenigmarchaeota archaeon]|nr:hypothetical protein [Candidatus Aenigmarchaeota archaeon]
MDDRNIVHSLDDFKTQYKSNPKIEDLSEYRATLKSEYGMIPKLSEPNCVALIEDSIGIIGDLRKYFFEQEKKSGIQTEEHGSAYLSSDGRTILQNAYSQLQIIVESVVGSSIVDCARLKETTHQCAYNKGMLIDGVIDSAMRKNNIPVGELDVVFPVGCTSKDVCNVVDRLKPFDSRIDFSIKNIWAPYFETSMIDTLLSDDNLDAGSISEDKLSDAVNRYNDGVAKRPVHMV